MEELTATQQSPAADTRDAAPADGQDVVARVSDLSVSFRRSGLHIQAVRGISLDIRRGEILGLVGESGSGKSVLGLSLLGLLPAEATIGGGVDRARHRHGARVRPAAPHSAQAASRRRLPGPDDLAQPDDAGRPSGGRGGWVATRRCGCSRRSASPTPNAGWLAFPHELSGGLRQRVMIAMAIAGSPSLVVADEPTTALDVTVQAQILELLRSLRDDVGCSFCSITHDLGVAAQVADRIAVLYAGRLAEVGPAADVLRAAAHPYSAALPGPGCRSPRPAGRPAADAGRRAARPARHPRPAARSRHAARCAATNATPDPGAQPGRAGPPIRLHPAGRAGARHPVSRQDGRRRSPRLACRTCRACRIACRTRADLSKPTRPTRPLACGTWRRRSG